MTATLFYLSILLLPGALAGWLSRVTKHRFFFALSISVALYIFSQIPFRVGGGSLLAWLVSYGLALAALVFLSHRLGRRTRNTAQGVDILTTGFLKSPYALAIAGLLISWWILWSFIGSYTEVPSDFWGHLVRTQWELSAFNSGRISRYASSWFTSDLFNREYLHSLHALAWWCFSQTPAELAEAAQLALTTVFICSVFCFACALFPEGWNPSQRSLLAALATVLTISSLGIGNWAFIRYYAFAPVMLNLPLYFFGVLLVIEWLRASPAKANGLLVSIFFILILTSLIHVQEAVFLAVVSFLLLQIAFIQSVRDRFDIWPLDNLQKIKRSGLITLAGITFIAVFLLWQLPMKYSHPGVLLNMGELFWLLDGLHTLNPDRQFLTVLGLSGVSAYLVAIFYWRSVLSSPYLVATLLLPLLTVFNPIFIELWQRILPVTLLWRFGLLIPSGFVLAYTIGAVWNDKQRQTKGDAFLLTIALALFVPTDLGKTGLLSGRLPSFLPLSNSQNIRWLEDVAEFLDTQPRQVVYTDPVTSYVLRGMTGQSLPGRKFYPNTSGFNFSDMSADAIARLDSGFLLINRRNGAASRTVAALPHWKEKELHVSRFYPDNFPDTLKRLGWNQLWEHGQVSVYER